MSSAADRPRFRGQTDVVCRTVGGETFLVPIRGRLADLQDLFVLNPTGAWLWTRLDGSRSSDDLARELTTEFEVSEQEATADVEEFLSRLADAGLVEEL